MVKFWLTGMIELIIAEQYFNKSLCAQTVLADPQGIKVIGQQGLVVKYQSRA